MKNLLLICCILIICTVLMTAQNNALEFDGSNDYVDLTDINLDFFMGNGSGYGVILDANGSTDQDITLSQWHHVAVSVNGTVCTMYLNGAQVDQETFSGTRQTGNQPVQIGRFNAGSLQLWDGKIDEVRI